jgi:hypothetical protein
MRAIQPSSAPLAHAVGAGHAVQDLSAGPSRFVVELDGSLSSMDSSRR